jgi:hypothetical protein
MQCYENEWIARDPFYKYEFTLDSVDIGFLIMCYYAKSIYRYSRFKTIIADYIRFL